MPDLTKMHPDAVVGTTPKALRDYDVARPIYAQEGIPVTTILAQLYQLAFMANDEREQRSLPEDKIQGRIISMLRKMGINESSLGYLTNVAMTLLGTYPAFQSALKKLQGKTISKDPSIIRSLLELFVALENIQSVARMREANLAFNDPRETASSLSNAVIRDLNLPKDAAAICSIVRNYIFVADGITLRLLSTEQEWNTAVELAIKCIDADAMIREANATDAPAEKVWGTAAWVFLTISRPNDKLSLFVQSHPLMRLPSSMTDAVTAMEQVLPIQKEEQISMYRALVDPNLTDETPFTPEMIVELYNAIIKYELDTKQKISAALRPVIRQAVASLEVQPSRTYKHLNDLRGRLTRDARNTFDGAVFDAFQQVESLYRTLRRGINTRFVVDSMVLEILNAEES